MKKILAINAGSSSLKYKVFSLPNEHVVCKGLADRIGIEGSTFSMKLASGEEMQDQVDISDAEAAIRILLDWMTKYQVIMDLSEIVGVGHRIVNGGPYFKDSAVIDHENLQRIIEMGDFAPLHNVAEAKCIKAFMKLLPGVPEVGVFDTSFHQSMDQVHYMYALPYEYYDKYKVRKYGAHGTSVRFVIDRAAKLMKKPLKDLKLIVCHLGSGASLTAVKNGKSFDTSMGFSPLAGVEMGTRTGDVDPSVVPYLMHKNAAGSLDELFDVFNHKSGLAGVSGLSSDMRDVREAAFKGNKRAKLAFDMFTRDVVRYIGAYYTEMGGADAVIFTAGIGEHEIEVRKAILDKLQILGLQLDEAANQKAGDHQVGKADAGEIMISTPDSKLKAYVIPTNEELLIERDVVRLTNIK